MTDTTDTTTNVLEQLRRRDLHLLSRTEEDRGGRVLQAEIVGMGEVSGAGELLLVIATVEVPTPHGPRRHTRITLAQCRPGHRRTFTLHAGELGRVVPWLVEADRRLGGKR